jgi:hypothetical protein
MRPTPDNVMGSIVWECQCDCGATVMVPRRRLIDGYRTGCGECGRLVSNIAGQKFGWVTAVAPTTERIRNSVVWECLCDCGKTTRIERTKLTASPYISCGCRTEARQARAQKNKNKREKKEKVYET